MSKRERDRLAIMAGVKRKELTLAQASLMLDLCYRQTKRMWRRYQDEGDAGLVHRLRGKPSPRRKPSAVRARVLELYAQEHHADFGPTLLAEHLERRKIEVDHETVQRWLLAEGKWTVRRRRQKHRQWRERKACFGAMAQLDVKLILANSPQAKGRVERINGVLQDRLVKELRLAGISDPGGANRFLPEYLAGFNRQFERQAASPLDVHRAAPRHLDAVLSWEEERVVQADWTVACGGGKWYQLDRQHEALSLVRRKVIVRRLRDGREQIEYRGTKLRWRALPGRPERGQAQPGQKNNKR